MNDLIGFVVSGFLFVLFVFGMYEVTFDDYSFLNRDMVIKTSVFPLPGR